MKRLFIAVMALWSVMTVNAQSEFTNPMMWADVPDPDVIRVGDDYWLVSTTMHLMPGAPVMHSKDLVNWKTVSYVFPSLHDTPKYDMQEGTVYGRGQWATSLRYHNGMYYLTYISLPTTRRIRDMYIHPKTRVRDGHLPIAFPISTMPRSSSTTTVGLTCSMALER